MQGIPAVIDALNRALTIELTAINQYFCQAKMCKNWGLMRLAAKHYEESMGEMRHAEKIIDRVLFLEGVPEIARYDVIRVGTDVKEQFENDLKLEQGGVVAYNELVDLCIREKDNGTHALALQILTDSEEHVDWLETQLGLIQMVGLEKYLAEQINGGEEEVGFGMMYVVRPPPAARRRRRPDLLGRRSPRPQPALHRLPPRAQARRPGHQRRVGAQHAATRRQGGEDARRSADSRRREEADAEGRGPARRGRHRDDPQVGRGGGTGRDGSRRSFGGG